jgi:ABC-type lipoprotein release transport system permease subunit
VSSILLVALGFILGVAFLIALTAVMHSSRLSEAERIILSERDHPDAY